MSRTAVTGRGCNDLAVMTKLGELHLDSSALSDAGLAAWTAGPPNFSVTLTGTSNSRSLNRDTAYSAHYAMGSLEVNILLEPRG